MTAKNDNSGMGEVGNRVGSEVCEGKGKNGSVVIR
jgi:hypothetical protein